MTFDKAKPFFDVSSAKEPPRSLNLDKEADPIEAKQVSEQSEKELSLDDFIHEQENLENVGEHQIITAHIPGGGIIPSENQ
ncbi:hypothetical protein H6G81_25455 [Scytonema hofmannii FACHB-248]|uniref:Uncharacterized protein n=1 Tax=Scytonema hofmannii FACHB-248 TaxID=1842502 RepID=A0ABR8GX17_9CYAN|nr:MULTISPECIES: hypothetical protein [Nostocales]MBD2607784.1 hypothetical protein [Scytonema hofmannii FACHB-248]